MYGVADLRSFTSLPTYTVHEPPEPDADRIDRASELLFVKDGFSWLTALFPPLGLAASRLWLPLLAYVVFAGVTVAGLHKIGVNPAVMTILILAVHIYLGFEHATLQRWILDNAGWQMLGSVTGKSLDDCERRFFETWLPDQPVISTATNKPVAGAQALTWRSSWSSLTGKS
jgi:hypothetical protein